MIAAVSLSVSNDMATEINNKLKEEALIIASFLAIILIVINFIPMVMTNYCKDGLPKVLLEVFIVCISIAGIELFFFTKVVSKIVPVTPSFIQQSIKDKLTSYLSKN